MEDPGEYHKNNIAVFRSERKAKEWVRGMRSLEKQLMQLDQRFFDKKKGKYSQLMRAKFGKEIIPPDSQVLYDPFLETPEVEAYHRELCAMSDAEQDEFRRKNDFPAKWLENANYDEVELYV